MAERGVQPTVDPKSLGSHALTLYAYARQVGIGTGFIVRHRGVHVLVSNYHVLAGRHPETGELMGPAVPDRVLVPALSRHGPGIRWGFWVQRLISEGGDRYWVEHPTNGSGIDIAACPLSPPDTIHIFPYDHDPGPDLDVPVSSDVAIIGFPEGLSGPGISAIWKSGSIASEVELSALGDDFFWIDSNTRRGMSGAPVVARRFGAALMREGLYQLGRRVVDRTLGVYAGRAYDAQDMTLGRVWTWSAAQEVIEATVSQVHRGVLMAETCSLGHISTEGVDMVKVDPKKSVKIPVVDQHGAQSEQEITLGKLVRDLALADQRMGENLAAVRRAATIEAALTAAEKEGKEWELTDEDYSLLRECFDRPSMKYNPHLARLTLPVIEYFMAAGGAQE